MSIGRTLFLIFMPLVYKVLEAIMEDDYLEDMNIKRFIFEVFQVVFYYAIEGVYLLEHHSITNEWLFMKDRTYSDFWLMFVFCSVIFIFFSVFSLLECYDFICYHIVKLIILTVLFIIFMLISNSFVSFTMDEKNFQNMPYEKVSEDTIELRAFSDTTAVDGNIHGGMFYISGKIQENYELYYAFMAEDGSLTIRHFTYNEAHCKIFPEKDCTQPRIEITNYAKVYKDNYSSYCDYVIHIPDNSIIGYEMDLQ